PGVDGMILTDGAEHDPRFEVLADNRMPAVLVGTPFPGTNIAHVESPNPEAGVEDAVEHLFALGHRRIAYIGGTPGRYQSEARRSAFRAALAAQGLTPFDDVFADYVPERAAEETRRMLGLATAPTAILYASDAMAIASIRTAGELGVRVPEDLSIIGYGGADLGEWMTPALTTVVRDAEQRGRAAAITLLRLLGESPQGDAVLKNPELVLRASTAAVHD
ncbi:LacI family DNA-binding transcriptional regulator, partial [Microbacterium sp. AGC85]